MYEEVALVERQLLGLAVDEQVVALVELDVDGLAVVGAGRIRSAVDNVEKVLDENERAQVDRVLTLLLWRYEVKVLVSAGVGQLAGVVPARLVDVGVEVLLVLVDALDLEEHRVGVEAFVREELELLDGGGEQHGRRQVSLERQRLDLIELADGRMECYCVCERVSVVGSDWWWWWRRRRRRRQAGAKVDAQC